MRRASVCGGIAVLLALWCGGVFGTNLLVDADFSPDRLGGLLNWECTQEPLSAFVTRTADGACGSAGAVRIAGLSRGGSFIQNDIRLVPGEPYRLSASVRTRGLPERGVSLVLYGIGWKGREMRVHLPPDTQGEWVRIETSCKSVTPVRDDTYFAGLHCAADLPSDAVVEMSSPCLEALSERGRVESRPRAENTAKTMFRIVPIAPKLAWVDPEKGEMEFYYGADLDRRFADYSLRAYLDGELRASAALNASRRVSLTLGASTVGKHVLRVELVDTVTGATVAENTYPVQCRTEETHAVGRRLNNLVTELMSEPLTNRTYSFVNPRAGWVFVGFDGAGADARGFIDGAAEPAVVPRPGEPLQTMRWLAAGRHTLDVRGTCGGTLAVRAVKAIVSRPADACPTDIRTHHYGLSFFRRFVLPWYNTVQNWRDPKPGSPAASGARSAISEYLGRGMAVQGAAHLPSVSARRGTVEGILAALTDRKWGWQTGRDLFFDENRMGGPLMHHENFAEALWRVADSGQAVNTCYADGERYPFDQPRAQANEIAAVVNSGFGRGCLALEAYPQAYPDAARAIAFADRFLRFAKSAEAMVPAAKGSTYYHFAYWLLPGANGYDGWTSAAADFRVLSDAIFRRVAADPAFAETVWGVGFGAFFTTDEEMVRWMMRLVRHYAIEGRTDSLAESLGYPYNPGYVQDGDFTRGLEAWNVQPAQGDSLRALTIPRYGLRGQSRGKHLNGVDGLGDTLALFERRAERPNRLSQRISGLVPGRRYALVYISQDYDQYLKTPGAQGKESAFRVDFEGAENVAALETACGGMDYQLAKPGHYYVYRHRLVFRATAPEVTIIFLDRAPGEGEAVSNRLGQRRMINFIHVHDYFEGEPGDVEDLIGLKTEE